MDSKQNKVDAVRTENGVAENASSEEIREEIRGTRRGMDDTLDQIGERLHPRHLLDDVFDLFRGGERASNSQLARTSKEVGRTVSRAVREHPLPALLVGAGIAWWIIDAVNAGDGDDDGSYPQRNRGEILRPPRDHENWGYNPYPGPRPDRSYSPVTTREVGNAEPHEQSSMENTGQKLTGAASAIGDKLSAAGATVSEKVVETASAVGDSFREGAGAVSSAASAGWERGKRTLQDYSEQGTRTVSRQLDVMKDRFSSASDEYPLAMGGVFLAAGMLMGLLLPRSEKEDEWLGETSDAIKDDASNLAEQAVEKGKSVAAKTAAAAVDEAEAQGIVPENATEKASQIGSEAGKSEDAPRAETR